MSRFEILDRIGRTFLRGGVFKRDLYRVAGYLKNLTYEDYRQRYERDEVASIVVDIWPRLTWTSEMAVREKDAEEDGQLETEVQTLDSNHSLFSKFMRVDILARIGGYSALVIGAAGNINEELPTMRGPEDILYLTPRGTNHIKSWKLSEDTSSPLFGTPIEYLIDFGGHRGTSLRVKGSSLHKVHWTRVLHVAESVTDNDFLGKPALRGVWNRLDDLNKLVSGGTETAWRSMAMGHLFSLDPDMPNPNKGELEEKYEEMVHGLGRFMAARGLTSTDLSSPVPQFQDNVMVVLRLIAANQMVPWRMFFGSEQAQLASQEDSNTLESSRRARIEWFAQPLVTTLIRRLMNFGALIQVDEFDVLWPKPRTMTDLQRTEAALNLARANRNNFRSEEGIILTSSEIRRNVFDLPPLSDDAGSSANSNGNGDDSSDSQES